ncbi:MAG: 30S ribosomal protein S9 [Candidatus Hydrogenedentota bacterium]
MADTVETVEILEPIKQHDDKSGETVAVGRRKEATARLRLKPGTGLFLVNGQPLEEYLARDTLVRIVRQVYEVTDTLDKFDVRARCTGGGLAGQAGALRLALARALLKYNPNLKSTLRSFGMLTRDAREVERKKYGQPKARKRFQFSKR